MTRTMRKRLNEEATSTPEATSVAEMASSRLTPRQRKRQKLRQRRLPELEIERSATPEEVETAVSLLGAALLHVEKSERDLGFSRFESWFKEHREGLTFMEYRKIWSALFYSYWLADKFPKQNELAVRMCLLVRDMSADRVATFIGAFYSVIDVEWGKLDRHRIQKYTCLCKMFLAECLEYLKRCEWNDDIVDNVFAALEFFGPLRHSLEANIAVSSLFLDSFLPELRLSVQSQSATVNHGSPHEGRCAELLPTKTVVLLLEPFYRIVEATDPVKLRLVQAVHEKIFQRLTEADVPLEVVLDKMFQIASVGNLCVESSEWLWESISYLKNQAKRSGKDPSVRPYKKVLKVPTEVDG